MIKLIDVLVEDAANDIKKSVEANKIIDYVLNKIKEYQKDNNIVQYYIFPGGQMVVVIYRDLTIEFVSYSNGNTRANYTDEKKLLIVFNCDIVKSENGLQVSGFDRDVIQHELIHYIDLSRQFKGDKVKYTTNLINRISQKQQMGQYSAGYEIYINNPIEFNAHFFQYVFPLILKYVDKHNIINKPFKDFYKEVTSNYKISEFMGDLNEKNLRKFQKRIAMLYQELRKSPEELEDLKNIDVNNLEQEKKKYTWLKRIWDQFINNE